MFMTSMKIMEKTMAKLTKKVDKIKSWAANAATMRARVATTKENRMMGHMTMGK